jgi:hypothetical protein
MLEKPLHNNSIHSGQTLFWTGSDQKEIWQKNMLIADRLNYLTNRGWSDEHAIEYKYNSHGFRCAEFDNTPSYIAIGCSHTEGVGLSAHQSWPARLANKLNQPVLNLGVGGSSFDTCFRLIDYYINYINVLGVFVLEPPSSRFEIFEQAIPITILPSDEFSGDRKVLRKYWITSRQNVYYNVKKNKLALQALCNIKQIPCISLSSDSPEVIGVFGNDSARDLLHYGILSHDYIASKFLDKYLHGTT